ncbi:MAG: 3-deoxy-manno-octulosonate cytidylyltransferase [Verrucomicrobiota bacterium]|nr:3-deoxy-manno-octulosonate cytidylyltransferase [Verrucomicrobiota bacterium]
MKAVGIIPARWASTRFPGKALHPIAGKPLLQHVWERCCQARSLASVIIATDDMRIAEAAFAWGAEVALTSSRHQSGTDRVAEVAHKAPEFTHIINIQGDEPLTDPKLLDRLVREMAKDSTIEMITAAHPFADAADVASPHQVKVVRAQNGDALYFSRAPIPVSRNDGFQAAKGLAADTPGRRGSRPSLHLRHQGIYGYTRETLLRFVAWKPSPLERAEFLEQLRALENGVRIRVLVTGSGSPGVDTPADAEAVARELVRLARKKVPPKRKKKAR